MMVTTGKIFISYRRSDSTKDARAVYERLCREFGEQRVFIDLEGIEPGEDFVATLERNLEGCEMLVALIGPGWTQARTERGEHRLHDPDDFVRIELHSALKRGIKVFPVLIDGAPTPRADQLPADLQPLVRRQAIVLDYTKFETDVTRLVQAIRTEAERDAWNWRPYGLGAAVVVGGVATLFAIRPPAPSTVSPAPPPAPAQPVTNGPQGAPTPTLQPETAPRQTQDIMRALKAANLTNSVGDSAIEQWLNGNDRHYRRLAEGCLQLIGEASLSADGADLDKINAFYSIAIGLRGEELMPPSHKVDAKKLAQAIVDAYNDKNGGSAYALSQVLR